jgi:hypothetical protein
MTEQEQLPRDHNSWHAQGVKVYPPDHAAVWSRALIAWISSQKESRNYGYRGSLFGSPQRGS